MSDNHIDHVDHQIQMAQMKLGEYFFLLRKLNIETVTKTKVRFMRMQLKMRNKIIKIILTNKWIEYHRHKFALNFLI